MVKWTTELNNALQVYNQAHQISWQEEKIGPQNLDIVWKVTAKREWDSILLTFLPCHLSLSSSEWRREGCGGR